MANGLTLIPAFTVLVLPEFAAAVLDLALLEEEPEDEVTL